VLPIAPDDGGCGSEILTPPMVCRFVRVTAQANGSLTVQAISQGNAGPPLVSAFLSNNEVGGNPVTLQVDPTIQSEFFVAVGLSGGFTTTQSVVVKTSFAP
jgi:hypothetical protein